MSKKKVLLITAALVALVSLVGASTYVFLTRENPETVREMKRVDDTQENLDKLLGELDGPPNNNPSQQQ
jgi:hypothetical protein